MLLRYGTSENGTIEKKAHIYVRDEHGIDPKLVDPDAVWVIRRLRGEGFHAYVVGGAVRDMLVGRAPHDFDVATDALPPKIRRVFRSARLIGRRFRIVHVYTSHEKFIEVTTFRSNKSPDEANLFGTMEEDAQRRDFTVNALYYCPVDQQVIDYVGGFDDVRQKRLRTLVPAETSFTEDPVRMIRAVKYASITGFPIPLAMASLLRRKRDEILRCSRERVTEEVYKILTSGSSSDILSLAHRLRLFEVLFPALNDHVKAHRRFDESRLHQRLLELDQETREGKELAREQMFAFLFRDVVEGRPDLLHDPDPAFLIQQFLRSAAEPLFPSKRDIAVATHGILGQRRHAPRPSPHGERGPRKQGGRPPGRRRRRRGGKRQS